MCSSVFCLAASIAVFQAALIHSVSSSSVQDGLITEWIKAAWNTAIEAAKQKTLAQRGWTDIDGKWIDPDDLFKQLEILKTS